MWRTGRTPVIGALSRLVAALLLGFVLVGALARPAGAHAHLVSTTPVSDEVVVDGPAEVVLRFSEPVTEALSGIEVIDPNGKQVAGEATRTDGGTTLIVPIDSTWDGTYTVVWRVVSEDGHTVEGSYVFHLNAFSGAAVIEERDETLGAVVRTVGRGLVAAGTVLAIGAVAFALFSRRIEAGAAAIGGMAVVGGSFLSLLARVADASDDSLIGAFGSFGDAITETRFGKIEVARMALGTLVAAGWWWQRTRPLWVAWTGVSAVAAAVLSAIGGHPWTASTRWLGVTADIGHQVGAGVWIGGLVALALALHRVRADEARPLVAAFSRSALVAVAVVTATGIVSGFGQVRGLGLLFTTGYGVVLVMKVVVVAVVVTIGWYNRELLAGALERGLGKLRTNVHAEIALAAVVIGLTSGLVDMTPARYEGDVGAFEQSQVQGNLGLAIIVDPAIAGLNSIHLTFFAVDGSIGGARVDAIRVEGSTPEIPTRELDVPPVTADHFSGSGISLTSGTWTIVVTAVRQGEPTTFTFEVGVR